MTNSLESESETETETSDLEVRMWKRSDSHSPPRSTSTDSVMDGSYILDDSYRSEMAAWAKNAVDLDERLSPPDMIVLHTDLLEYAWGWDRMVVFKGMIGWSIYTKYLKEYYSHNRMDYVCAAAADQNPEEWPLKSAEHIQTNANGNGLAAVAEFCLKMEERFMSELKKQEGRATTTSIICSSLIQQHARLKIRAKFSATAAAALLCIAKEADLMCELLRHSAEDTNHLIDFSDRVRLCALSLMDCQGCDSVAAAAAMVGISKEAKLMCEWIRKENKLILGYDPDEPDEVIEVKHIRKRMFDLMLRILEGSSGAAVHNPDKIESKPSCEAVHDGNGNGIADAKGEESAGKSTSEKLKCPGHKNDTEKRKRKRKRKRKKQKTLEGSSGAAVHNPDKIESKPSCEVVHDGNGSGIADAKVEESAGKSTSEKLKCLGHKNETENRKRKRKKQKQKTKRQMMENLRIP